MSDERITRQWIIDHIGAATFERLARELSASQLQSVLLEVMRARALTRAPAELLGQYQRDPFCRPTMIDQRTSVMIDGHLLAAADGFEAIELSPVAPLGACAAIAPTDQNRVLSALRNTEVVSDPTNVLALECAGRLRATPVPVHLATSQRVIRTQPVPQRPGHASHFRIFVLASGGIEQRDHAFTAGALVRHIRTVLDALDRLEQHGFAFGARAVHILATPDRAALGDRVAHALGGTATERKLLDHPYYSGGLRYMLWVTAPDGAQVALFDGGAFDWLAKLTSNRRAVYIASGGGAQLIAFRFRTS